MIKRRRPAIAVPTGAEVGFAWFTPEQWQRLTEVVDDRSELDETFEQWERNAQAALYELESQGHSVRKIMIDVETFVSWCRARGRRVDGPARAGYVVALLKMADSSA